MKHFRFTDERPERSGFVRLVNLSSRVSTRDGLFRVLARDLDFPDYFGRNWDALEELLNDLSWLPEGRVRIRHTSLPDLPQDALATWLEVLADVEGRLEVTFEPDDRERVQALLG